MQNLIKYTLIGGIIFTNLSFSAGFNCKKAGNFVEKTICNDTSLSLQDSYMSIVYSKLTDKDETAPLQDLRASQKKWIQNRNLCTTKECLVNAYDQRISQLQQMDGTPVNLKTSAIEGKWMASYSNQIAASTLNIKQVDDQSFSYQIEANNGANSGEMESKAVYFGNDALTVDNSMVDDQSFDVPCLMLFQGYKNQLQITQNASCSYYAGQGVYFSGTYLRQEKETIATLQEQGMLNSKEQEERFKTMTGEKYSLFVDGCGGMKSESESTQPKATVREGFMRGVAPDMACIVMFNNNNLWAAVIGEEPNQVLYFTDNARDKNILPSAIMDWVKGLEKTNNKTITVTYPTE